MYQRHKIMILKNKGNCNEINAYQVSCSVFLPLYNMSSCQSMSLYGKFAYLHDRSIIIVDSKKLPFCKPGTFTEKFIALWCSKFEGLSAQGVCRVSE